MNTNVSISRITLAYDNGEFRGGDIQRRATISDDSGHVITTTDLPLEAIAGTVQQGVELAGILGEVSRDAIVAAALALARERQSIERLASAEQQSGDLGNQLAAAKDQLAAAKENIAALNQQLATAQEHISTLDQQLATTKAELAKVKADLDKAIAAPADPKTSES